MLRRVTVFAACCLPLFLLSVTAEPTVKAELIVTDVCIKGADSNLINSLPRRDQSFTDVSNNWGDYPGWFDCTGPPTDRECEVVEFETDFSSDSRQSYAEGLALYAALPVLGMVLVPLFVCCLMFWRYCTCCCCKRSQKCKCGAKFPTRKTMWVGYAPQPSGSFGYTKCSKICSLVYLLLFLILTSCFIALGELKGNAEVPNAAKSLADSPTAFMDVAVDSVAPSGNFLQNIASTTLRNFMSELREIVTNATDIPQVRTDLGCVLLEIDRFPVISDIRNVLDELENGTNALDTSLGDLKRRVQHTDLVLRDLDRQAVGDTMPVSNGIQFYMSEFGTQATALSSAVSSANTALTGINTIQDEFSGTPDGHAVAAQRELERVRDNYPTDPTLDSNVALITELIDGDATGDTAPAEAKRLEIITSVSLLQADFDSGLPSFTDLGTQLRDFNAAVQSTRTGALQEIFDVLELAEVSIDNVYSTEFLNSTLRNFINGTDFLQLSELKDSLLDVQTAIDGLIDFDRIRDILNAVRRVENIIPCLNSATDQLLNLNVTVITLPDEVKEIVDLSDDLQETLNPTLETIDDVLGDLGLAEAEIENTTVSAYATEVTDAQTLVDDGLAKIDINGFDTSLATLDANRNIDFTSTTADVFTFNQSLVDASFPESVITALESLETIRVNLATKLGRLNADMTIFNQGFCSFDNSTLCSADTDCPDSFNLCLALGEPRCANDQRKVCSNSADCGDATGSSDRCLLDAPWLSDLRTELTASKSTRPDVSDAIAAMVQLRDDADYDLTSLQSELGDIVVAIDDVDVSSVSGGIDDYVAASGDVNINVYLNAIDDTRGQLDVVDYTGIRSELDSFEGTVDDFRGDNRDIVIDAINGTDALDIILNSRFPTYLDRLSAASLTADRARGGISEVIRSLVFIADDASAVMADKTTFLDDPTTLAEDLEDTLETIDKVALPENAAHGSLFFFGNLFMEDRMIDPADPTADTFDKDTNNNKYPLNADGDRMLCLTRACIDRSIDRMENEKLSESSDVPVPLTRRQLVLALYIFPILVVLLGILSLACFAFCCHSRPSWQKVPVSWMTGFIYCQLPCIFLLLAPTFPLIMFFGDSCQGAPNVGLQWVDGMGDTLCVSDSYVGGRGSLEACTYSKDVQDSEFNFTINLRLAYIGVMSECPEEDPFSSIWDGVADVAAPIPLDEINDFIDELDDFTLGDPVQQILRDAGASAGDNIRTFADEMREVISCDAFNSAFNSAKNSMCCEFLSSVYWIAASWWLIAIAYCSCGCCAGLMARKRLASKPWGSQYEEDDVGSVPHPQLLGAANMNDQTTMRSLTGHVDPVKMAELGNVHDPAGEPHQYDPSAPPQGMGPMGQAPNTHAGHNYWEEDQETGKEVVI